ncbi:hypothetical protein SADUNF_Sadunf06G0153900 [Salix dunnii]|uniref:Transposase-associated domain-containing protein n=1 Tax=Salix dunnii TaxID=1413687 RepID=A0A835MXN9_9ROSI|nr:hypothetical protein SADUNF_Sadunf06G0153900 [Salix dunnii]
MDVSSLMDGRLNSEYIVGVRRFINFLFSINKNISGEKIRCPCVRSKNQKFLKEDDVCKQLLIRIVHGVRRIINFSFSINKNISGEKIRYSCVRRKNQKFLKKMMFVNTY